MNVYKKYNKYCQKLNLEKLEKQFPLFLGTENWKTQINKLPIFLAKRICKIYPQFFIIIWIGKNYRN